MREIELENRDVVVMVDDEDFDRLSVYEWRLNPFGYAYRWDGRSILMHREIMGFGGLYNDMDIHHENENRLDNRKDNLRIVTKAEHNKEHKAGEKCYFWGNSHLHNKLTEEQVIEIKGKYTGKYGEQVRLAKEYGVNKVTIWEIVHGRKWKRLNKSCQ